MQESDEQQPSSIILGSQGENDADQLIPSASGLLLHPSDIVIFHNSRFAPID